MVISKRSRDEEGGERSCKHAKLEDDRIASPQVGANLIQVNGKTCTHEVAWPPGVDGNQLPPGRSAAPAAKEYAFPLDPFQQTAINSLETGKGGTGAHSTACSPKLQVAAVMLVMFFNPTGRTTNHVSANCFHAAAENN